MEIALIVGFALILFLCLLASALAYSNYVYSKNRLFSKTKYPILWIVISAFMAIFMLITGILFCVSREVKYADVYVGLSFTNFTLCVVYLIYFCLLPKLTNANKITYDQMLKVNYEEKINKLLNKTGNFEQYKEMIAKKNHKYCENMLVFYEGILQRLKDEKIPLAEKMADIVTFNDAFTHKWSSKTNLYQEYLSLKFCQLLEKIS